jgi:hypothetical protein
VAERQKRLRLGRRRPGLGEAIDAWLGLPAGSVEEAWMEATAEWEKRKK